MKQLKIIYRIFFVFLLISFKNEAQLNTFFGKTKLVIVGHSQIDYSLNKNQNEFSNLAFKPIFLWSLSEKLFIESELEIMTNSEDVEVAVEQANFVYFLNKYLVLHAGRFVPKFGSYRGKYMESYLNRFATDPIGFGDGGIGPMTEMGIGIQGGANFKKMRVNYDFYLTNGPHFLTGNTESPDEAGQFDYEAYTENNKNKAIGGRFGILPISDASLEIGFSFQHANKTGQGGTIYEDVKVDMLAIDLNYIKFITPLYFTTRLIGEWKSLAAGRTNFNDFITGNNTYTFNNNSTAEYVQASIRPTGTTMSFFNNLEFSGRYSQFNTPNLALWGGGIKMQTAISLNYWLGWNRVFKISYQKETNQPNTVIAQLIYGF